MGSRSLGVETGWSVGRSVGRSVGWKRRRRRRRRGGGGGGPRVWGGAPPPPPPGPLEGVQVRSLLSLRGVLLLRVAGGLHLQAACWLSWPVRATLSRHQLLQQALQERAAVRPLGASSATPSPQARASKWRSCGSPCTCMPVQPGSDRSGTHPCSWPTRQSACSGTPRRWQPRAPA